jgi:predicted enzyme related to lactoylglutathione lyase
MARVVHFEFNAEDPERAVRFYSDVFGWRIQKWAGPADYWLAQTGEGVGIDGAMQAAPDFVEGQRAVVTMDVDSVDEVARKVEAAGGSIVLPKMAIPNVGWLIYCRDTEGMVFGAMQSDASARAEPVAAPAAAAAPASAPDEEAGEEKAGDETGGDETAGHDDEPRAEPAPGDVPEGESGPDDPARRGGGAAVADEPAPDDESEDDEDGASEGPGDGRSGPA